MPSSFSESPPPTLPKQECNSEIDNVLMFITRASAYTQVMADGKSEIILSIVIGDDTVSVY